MAGIGFELKKLFQKKGVFALMKAYGYAGIVCTGPMLLGLLLLSGVHFISEMAGLPTAEQDLLTCMITYTLLASLVITNGMGMISTRFTADCLYEEKPDKILPSFHGSIGIMMLVGGIAYIVFLSFTDIPLLYAILSYILFEELIVVWTQMNYLTAIKDYKGIMLVFLVALIISLTIGYILTCVWNFPTIPTLLASICVAYGLMALWYYILLLQYFPIGRGSKLEFLQWLDKYPALFFCGLFISVGMFGHLVLMWASPIGVQIHGLYYMAPQYDVPALVAFLSTLVTNVNFVTSVEVNFYPKYRTYYSLFNDEGALPDIEQAEKEMRVTLQDELSYTAAKQVFITIIFVVLGTIALMSLPLGFNEEMLGIFRVLCLGYAFFAIGNSVMLMSLYFADEAGALVSTLVFAVTSVIATIVMMGMSARYYGFGFVIGSFCFMVTAILRLWYYQRRISYYILSRQPIVMSDYVGFFTRIARYFMKRNAIREARYEEWE